MGGGVLCYQTIKRCRMIRNTRICKDISTKKNLQKSLYERYLGVFNLYEIRRSFFSFVCFLCYLLDRFLKDPDIILLQFITEVYFIVDLCNLNPFLDTGQYISIPRVSPFSCLRCGFRYQANLSILKYVFILQTSPFLHYRL